MALRVSSFWLLAIGTKSVACIYIYIYIYMNHSLNSLKGGYIGDSMGTTIGVIKGDTRSLDKGTYVYVYVYVYRAGCYRCASHSSALSYMPVPP